MEKAELKEKERLKEEARQVWTKHFFEGIVFFQRTLFFFIFQQKRVESNFRQLLKSKLESISEQTKWDDIKGQIENESYYLALSSDDDRTRIFEEFRRQTIADAQAAAAASNHHSHHHKKNRKEKKKRKHEKASSAAPGAGSVSFHIFLPSKILQLIFLWFCLCSKDSEGEDRKKSTPAPAAPVPAPAPPAPVESDEGETRDSDGGNEPTTNPTVADSNSTPSKHKKSKKSKKKRKKKSTPAHSSVCCFR